MVSRPPPGLFTSHYSLTFIEVAQMVPAVPPPTAAQREAIDLLMTLADRLSFAMRFEAGDMQLVNNHVIYHARTALEDDADSGRVRFLCCPTTAARRPSRRQSSRGSRLRRRL